MTTSIHSVTWRRVEPASKVSAPSDWRRDRASAAPYGATNWLDAQSIALKEEPSRALLAPAIRSRSSSRFDTPAKRLLDILVALCALGFCAPLMLLIALLIKLDSPGPVLFRQERCGRDRCTFEILKFRTMKPSDETNIIQAKAGDARITRCGGLLRRSSLDELPQLLNVLAGDMSIVGPRPHAIRHDAVFERHVRDYGLRFRCKPGIIGVAQLNGARGEIRSRRDIVRRTKLDLLYQRRWSIFLDIGLILSAPFRLINDALDRRAY